jgi:hypothetical protein
MADSVPLLIERFVQQIHDLIASHANDRIRATLAQAFGTVGSPPRAGRAPGGRAVGRPTRLVAQRRLQGQYLGALKRLRGAARARVKTIARTKGVAEAVKLAARLG